ncbi:Mor transcription activator family protein [Chitinimonas sp. PSY-7]|uniref:Mor transcription activator family protein n=1 Tax=Chitinimonas sp. PSY-7 TaxID=3459088 RepID=UPI00403FF4B0
MLQHTPHHIPEIEPDLVDRVLQHLVKEIRLTPDQIKATERAVRAELGGERAYIRRRPSRPDGSNDMAKQVMVLFNGRNAAEVARKLGIGRATVYRVLKRARKVTI